MTILTGPSLTSSVAEEYRSCLRAPNAELVIGGYWSQSPNHSGHLSYYLTRSHTGAWVMTARTGAFEKIVAICSDAAFSDTASSVARAMYDAVVAAGGAEIEEDIESGLISDE